MNLKRGINLGGYLSQCDYSEEHIDTFIQEADLARIAGWGMDHVRVPVDACVLETDSGMIRSEGFGYLDRLIGWCETYGLDMILDLHKAYGYDFNNGTGGGNSLFEDPAMQKRFIDLWCYLADRYGSNPHIAFELLNEIVEESVVDAWNSLIARTVTGIRKYAPTTPIIYGGIQWNSAKTLRFLEKPVTDNVIFTFHFYEPLLFTHQKAYWVPAMDPDQEIPYPATMDYYRAESKKLGYQGNVAVKAAARNMGPEFMEELIADAVQAAGNMGVALYCGEFGVIDRAPLPDTIRWFRDMDTVCRKYDIGYSVWTYRGKDFGLVDEHYSSIQKELIGIWTM